MIRKTLVGMACLAGLMGMALASEDAPPEHQKWMKDLGNQMGALRKGIDVEKNATDMQAVIKQVAGWWKNRTSDVAGKSCTDSESAAAEVVKAAQAGDKAAIGAGMKAIGAGCKGCHDVHREKVSETLYRIK
ncbi:MAG: cytochrome c [Acidobacteria bacterium]|nr:cytochrome c [Acidobacteriota bacterium]